MQETEPTKAPAAGGSASASGSAGGSGSGSAEGMTSADYYFDSYSHFGIHEEMLKDRVRTEAYMNSIYHNRHLFRGKVVLDVGCGTGILSMFAAKAGARRVIGIDCAAIIHQAREIVAANGLSDVVTLLQGRAEDVTLPDGIEKVDIIISEWMGYFLLCVGRPPQLRSVPPFSRAPTTAARAHAGTSRCSTRCCSRATGGSPRAGCSSRTRRRSSSSASRTPTTSARRWASGTTSVRLAARRRPAPHAQHAPHGAPPPLPRTLAARRSPLAAHRPTRASRSTADGFDMSCVKRLAMQEPVVDVVDADQICTSASCVLSIDLATVTLDDLAFSAPFCLTAARNDYVHALVAYFDCTFSACHKPITLSTSPRAPYTHWKQTVLYFEEVLVLNAGESLKGEIRVQRNQKNPRDVDIHVHATLDGEHGSYSVTHDYRLR